VEVAKEPKPTPTKRREGFPALQTFALRRGGVIVVALTRRAKPRFDGRPDEEGHVIPSYRAEKDVAVGAAAHTRGFLGRGGGWGGGGGAGGGGGGGVAIVVNGQKSRHPPARVAESSRVAGRGGGRSQ